MPCEKHKQHLEALADGKLNTQQINRLQHLLEQDNCQLCLDEMRQVLLLNELAQNWQQLEVPVWDAAAQVIPKREYNWNWLNLSSFACSALALILVLFRFEIHSTESGLLVSFAGQAQSQLINQQVHQKFSELQKQQTTYIDTRLNNFATVQNDRNMKLISTAVDLNRAERRQELGQLVSYWRVNQRPSGFQPNYQDSLNYLPLTEQDIDQLTKQDLELQE